MRYSIFASVIALVFGVALGVPCVAKQTSSVDFSRDVFQVLRRSCFECHGHEKQEGGLRLDEKTSVFDSSVIEAGNPDASEIVRRIELPKNHDEVMPVIGDPLSKREVSAIREWIADGAVWPDEFQPPPHWAYVAPRRAAWVNVSNESWIQNPIDRFVLARLDELNLTPSTKADDAVLLRRIYLDLIGLPPTLDEVRAFEADPSPVSLERTIDELLSRPQFGERWARPWLDLARYADSHGFQRDDFRDLWAYRDWVIRALNEDMPYDVFTIEQLAGDLLPDATQSQRIATGFHRCAPTNVEAGSLPEETRIEQVIDRVNTTASVWLGSTLECAQCHDHKFDPFTAKDYYRFLAFFNNTQLEADRQNPNSPSSIAFIGPSMAIANDELDSERSKIQLQRVTLKSDLAKRRSELEVDLISWVASLAERNKQAPQQHAIEVVGFESRGNTDTSEIRDDGAVLLVGSEPPPTDTYVVRGKLSASDVQAIRLDVLTDESLPGSGPGRGDSKRSNFVLHELTVSVVGADKQLRPLKFVKAMADFSQTNWDAAGAVDGDPKTGWAISPEFAKPHWAMFVLDEPLNPVTGNASAGIELQIEMSQQFGQARTIGCFKLSGISGNPSAESVDSNIVEIAALEPKTWTIKQRESLLDYRASLDSGTQAIERELGKNKQALDEFLPDTTQIMVELDQPRESSVFMRGDYRTPGEAVQPGTPEFLHAMKEMNGRSVDSDSVDNESVANRLTLARWLVDPSNPLVGRVAVNRWWGELFGSGLVRTPEDFGLKGETPTHPELLDWLAVEFTQNGWSMKHILKLIVMSATYQQSSAVSQELQELDDQNRWLARGPRVRLDAESIRDNALAIAGLISLKPYGPPIRPYQPDGIWSKVGGQNYAYDVSPGDEKYRRGVYVVIKRGAPYPSFVNFDADNRFACTVERSRSNTPLQALTLLNDPVYVEAAKAIAIRACRATTSQSIESAISDELRRCTARIPGAEEVAVLSRLYESQLLELTEDSARAKRLVRDVSLPKEITPAEFSAWYSIASVLLNLHETITKE